MEPVTTDILPPDASRSGKNTVYHHCGQLERRASYAVCLFTLEQFDKGKLRTDSECHQHIDKGLCSALALRAQEVAAGRALFFKERIVPVVVKDEEPVQIVTGPTKPESESYMRGWNAAGRLFGGSRPATKPSLAPPPKPTPKTASERLFGVKESSLADAVSNAAHEAVLGAKEPTPLVQFVAKLIREKDRDNWRTQMAIVIEKFRLDKDTQTRLVTAAKKLASSSHPLDKAAIPNLEKK
ncbi:hypothetical protein L1871_22625 (plasmid) [Aeromonas caviae]|uniref:Uncharacterized protein n=1 Tax=Aeromonas caviae TaxID=648 RepID=A0A6M4NRS6_AERCA|nr:hypothetical protein [Aeromonas caviae]QJR99797.1 Hypothetical protein [Aeromonas caviae]QMV81580.1 Hypothetical protein [Aeromonas caviae]UJQ39289.1 hypothetical protein L1871_22625 [Aeromonas caviae]